MWWVAAAMAADPSGSWAIVPNEDELAAVHAAAVEDGLTKLPWAMRPLARGQITNAVTNCRALALAATAEDLTTTCDGKTDHRFSTTAPLTVTGGDGKPYAATLAQDGSTWTLNIAGDDGGQRIFYRKLDDGTLEVTKEIFSGWMSEPFRWTVRYLPR